MQADQQQRDNKQNENWEAFSLCSSNNSGNDERLPIPGRESHTCDLDVFSKYLEEVKTITRHEDDQEFNIQVWDFIQSILQKAILVGYAGVDNPQSVIPKGPKDNQAFINKVLSTNLINPIHPNLIADESGIPLDIIFTELLYATKVGMMSMKLSPNCMRFGNVICSMEKFEDISSRTYCEGCRYDNSIDCLQKIKVVFTFNMDIFYVLAESLSCQPSKASEDATKVFAMVPATFSGSGFRYFLGCGDDEMMLSPTLLKGLYRIRCPVARTDSYLKVRENARESDCPGSLSLHVSDIVRRHPKSKRKTIEVPHGKFHLDIHNDTKSFFVCQIIQDDLVDDSSVVFLSEEEQKPITTAHALLSHRTYRHLFAEGTELMLRNVLSRMMITSFEFKPKRRGRPIRSLQA